MSKLIIKPDKSPLVKYKTPVSNSIDKQIPGDAVNVSGNTQEAQNKITFAGHATVLVEMDGVTLLTDPLLRKRAAHLARLVAVPDYSAWDVDAILISHMHWDHLDFPTLRAFGYDMPLIVPKGAAKLLKKKGFKYIEEIVPDQTVQLNGVKIIATPANHSNTRVPMSKHKGDSMGFIIDGSDEIYFAGDTDLFPEMENIGTDIDVALIPVWGYGPTIGSGHLDPYRAAKALEHLTPTIAIPIHWGTYVPIGMVWMQLSFMKTPPRSFAKHASIIAPNVEVKILEPGDSFQFKHL